MDDLGIGQRIVQLRGDMSQTAFAELLGVSRSSLLRYEKGERQPDADLLARLCDRLGADGHWLLTGSSRGQAGEASSRSQDPPNPASAGKELQQVWADAAERELSLASYRAAAATASHRSTWRVLAELRSLFPNGSDLAEINRRVVNDEISEREVQAALLLLLRAGVVEERTEDDVATYRAVAGLKSLRFRDDAETSAAVITVLEMLLNSITPALARGAGKIVATEVRVPTGTGRTLARTLIEQARQAVAGAAAQEGAGDRLSLILGVAVEEGAVLESEQPPEGSHEQS